ncbi:MAG: DMT family transporter [Myxococcaceae bacterium]|nr:DMT family transporter [Myxococcaceae bacterium]
MNLRVASGLLLGVLAISWAAIFIRLAKAPALTTAAWRLVLASVPLLCWALVKHRRELAALGARGFAPLVLSGVALAVHFGTWVSSLDYTSVASSVAIVTTTPIWVSLVERPPKRTVIGMVIAMAGTIVIAGTDFAVDPRALLGDALALVGAWCAATYLGIGKQVRARLGVGPYVGVVYPVAGVCLVLAALVAGAPLGGLSSAQWGWLVLLAFVPQLIGHSLLNWSLEHVSAALVAIAILGEPIFSTLLAIPILGEVPDASRVAGAAVVLAGVGIAAWSEANRPKETSVPAAAAHDAHGV